MPLGHRERLAEGGEVETGDITGHIAVHIGADTIFQFLMEAQERLEPDFAEAQVGAQAHYAVLVKEIVATGVVYVGVQLDRHAADFRQIETRNYLGGVATIASRHFLVVTVPVLQIEEAVNIAPGTADAAFGFQVLEVALSAERAGLRAIQSARRPVSAG
ncbi:hypothetical protein JOS77_10765 [Chromobacterium haemolyticum]|nr:hypothetical protein JOS77_10765 [Chromobacterium haemolyticum]